ncbi:MAG: hypothetical protein AB1810_15150 [Pseudomonadota bacterium]
MRNESHQSRSQYFSIDAFRASTHPTGWPAPIVHENGGCVNLSGDYQYHGQLDASSPGTFHSNIDLIVFGQKPAAREPEYVKVFHQQESGGLQYELVYADGTPSIRKEFKYKLICSDGWLTWERQGKGRSADSYVLEYASKYRLNKAQDGSLIMHTQVKTKNSFLLFFSYTDTRMGWSRFLPARAEKGQ